METRLRWRDMEAASRLASSRNIPVRRKLVGKLSWALIALGLAYLALSIGSGIWLMEGALHPRRRPVTGRNVFAQSIAKLTSSGAVEARISAADGAQLAAWYARPADWNGSTVVLLHGVEDNREGAAGYAAMFLRAHYAVVLPDSRAHGESGGALATYGLLESGDLRHWSKWIASQQLRPSLLPGCLYLFGESMGASIALEATAAVPGVCAAVAEAPFASFREIGYERIAQGLHLSVSMVKLVAWPVIESAFVYARLRYGLDFDRASPERKLAESQVPALLIAGLEDSNIPPRQSQRIAALAGPCAAIWFVPGAAHTGAASVDPEAFERKVLGWFHAHQRVAKQSFGGNRLRSPFLAARVHGKVRAARFVAF